METFIYFTIFGILATALVVIQTAIILFLTKWNKELRAEVERTKPPF